MLYLIIHGKIPAYGLCMVCGILIASALAWKRCTCCGENIDTLLIVVSSSLCGGFVGAKVLYLFVAYNDISQMIENLCRLKSELLFGDGLVFYGGLIGGIATGILTARIWKIDLNKTCWILIPCIPLAHSFGRIGCWSAGCCYGRIASYFPVQIAEAMMDGVLCIFLMKWAGSIKSEKKGLWLLKAYLIPYACFRFLIEYCREDAIRGRMAMFSTSQWISILIVIVCVLLGQKKNLHLNNGGSL